MASTIRSDSKEDHILAIVLLVLLVVLVGEMTLLSVRDFIRSKNGWTMAGAAFQTILVLGLSIYGFMAWLKIYK
jgi:hypothetical protein